jgi:hypothetical protein
MAVRPNSRALMPMASLSYIKALKDINFALKDPSTAMSDTTLATILLLTVFEQITSSGMELKGWSSHIQGAVAIIKSRELFIAVRELMVCSYPLPCFNGLSLRELLIWQDDPLYSEIPPHRAQRRLMALQSRRMP